MPATTLENRELTVQEWRNVADEANPAGPLYLAGEFAEADITIVGQHYTTFGASLCSASHSIVCC